MFSVALWHKSSGAASTKVRRRREHVGATFTPSAAARAWPARGAAGRDPRSGVFASSDRQ